MSFQSPSEPEPASRVLKQLDKRFKVSLYKPYGLGAARRRGLDVAVDVPLVPFECLPLVGRLLRGE